MRLLLSGKTSLAGSIPPKALTWFVPKHSGCVKQREPEAVPQISEGPQRGVLQLAAAVTASGH